MNFRALVILTLVSLNSAAPDAERRAGGFAIDPLPDPTGPSASGPATTIDPTSTSNTSVSSSTTDSSTQPIGTSNTESTTTGLPSISAPSLSTQPVTTPSTSSQASTSEQQSTAFTTVTPSDSGTGTSAAPTGTSSTSATPSNNPENDNTPVGTGTIVGLSVAGGIAVLGAVAFVIWKFTRKRFSEFDAEGEEIKWPELGHESHALPTRPTGRVGVDDDGYDEAGVDGAGRRLGNYAPSSTTGETSMADLHSYNDPYAIPPLPHLDPNQPYHDDPTNYGAHYDPYQGPVPQSFHDPSNVDRINSRSPAPTNYGRQSPGPSLSYSRNGF